jgi:Trk-type K+ transport system membrane component
MTLNITPQLSSTSHVILIIAMFVGRIGILSFLIMFISPAEKQHYKYPYENIMI